MHDGKRKAKPMESRVWCTWDIGEQEAMKIQGGFAKLGGGVEGGQLREI